MSIKAVAWSLLLCVCGGIASAQEKESKGAALAYKLRFDKDPKPCSGTPTVDELVLLYQDWQEWTKLQDALERVIAGCTGLEPTESKPAFVTLIHRDEAY